MTPPHTRRQLQPEDKKAAKTLSWEYNPDHCNLSCRRSTAHCLPTHLPAYLVQLCSALSFVYALVSLFPPLQSPWTRATADNRHPRLAGTGNHHGDPQRPRRRRRRPRDARSPPLQPPQAGQPEPLGLRRLHRPQAARPSRRPSSTTTTARHPPSLSLTNTTSTRMAATQSAPGTGTSGTTTRTSSAIPPTP